MKKIIIPLIFCLLITSSFAQVQRKVPNSKLDSTGISMNSGTGNSMKQKQGKLKALKELNLTKEQKQQMKTMRQDSKAEQDAITNDTTLTEAQRKEKLKAVKTEAAKKLQSILTEEQRSKLKTIKEEKSGHSNKEKDR